jgi:hypothetical protein
MPFIHTLMPEPDFSTLGADLPYHFRCPLCGEEFQKTVGWFESNNDLSCPNCKERISFDANPIRSALESLRGSAGVLWRSVGYQA